MSATLVLLEKDAFDAIPENGQSTLQQIAQKTKMPEYLLGPFCP